MADWIKMRTDLREDPAVYKLAAALRLDRDSVVGKLHAFWSWWDANSRDGRVDGAVTVMSDELARCDGFGAAMLAVGWLAEDAKGLTMPHFERHNGRAAKERAQGNQRQAAYRVRNAKSNAPVTRKLRPRDDLSVTRLDKSSSNKYLTVLIPPARSETPQIENSTTPTRAPAPSRMELPPGIDSPMDLYRKSIGQPPRPPNGSSDPARPAASLADLPDDPEPSPIEPDSAPRGTQSA